MLPFVDVVGYGGRDASDVMELVHTQWLITDEDNIQWRIRFLSEGRFEYTDPVFVDWEYWDTNPWCDNGRWKCEKNSLEMTFENSTLVYVGFVKNDMMAGFSTFISALQIEQRLWRAIRTSEYTT